MEKVEPIAHRQFNIHQQSWTTMTKVIMLRAASPFGVLYTGFISIRRQKEVGVFLADVGWCRVIDRSVGTECSVVEVSNWKQHQTQQFIGKQWAHFVHQDKSSSNESNWPNCGENLLKEILKNLTVLNSDADHGWLCFFCPPWLPSGTLTQMSTCQPKIQG